MSTQVTNTFQVKFQNNLELALQQKTARLLGAVVTSDDASAEKIKIKDLVGHVAPQIANVRHGDTQYGNRSFDGVWLAKPDEIYDADLIDNADKLATAIDLQGATTMSIAATIARGMDATILSGFYGSIISGKEGTTTTAFPGSQTIAATVGGASGAQRMNVAKLRAANKLLAQGHADPEAERFMVITAEQNDDLLTEVPATSSDFKGAFGGEVRDGRVTRLLGWNFIHMELNNTLLVPNSGSNIAVQSVDGSGYRKNPFWVKGGLVANFWQRQRTMVDQLPGKLGSWQVFAGTTVAASRTLAGLSGIILNSEA